MSGWTALMLKISSNYGEINMKRSDVLMLTNSDVYVCIWLKFLTWLVLDLFNFSFEILSNASDCEIRQLPSPQLCLAGNVEQWWDSSPPTWCGCSVMMSQHSLLGTTSGFPQEHLYLTSALCWESCQLWKREKLSDIQQTVWLSSGKSNTTLLFTFPSVVCFFSTYRIDMKCGSQPWCL